MRRRDQSFQWALDNWLRSCSSEAARPSGGWHETCGSAERMYVASPERAPGGMSLPYSARDADAFRGVLGRLPEADRVLFLEWHGQRTPSWADRESRRMEYLQARAKVLVLWMEAACAES